MIKTFGIRNFKSIRSLDIECRRINLFIGEPNTGKSNILEAIGLLSYIGHGGSLQNFVRIETMPDLFFNKNLENDIIIRFDNESLITSFKDGRFTGISSEHSKPIFQLDYRGAGELSVQSDLKGFKLYRFRSLSSFTDRPSDYLLPPDGSNLPALILTNAHLRSLVGGILSKFGWRLAVEPYEGRLKFWRELDGLIVILPYTTLSDTLQRIIFHLAAVFSNTDSVIAFEEPEAHAFPYYTKYLAELIALDKNRNQYFISTHNPYFLLSAIEKSPIEDVVVFVTYLEGEETMVKEFAGKDLEKLLEYDVDVFLNMDSLIKE